MAGEDWTRYDDLGQDGRLPVAGFRLLVSLAPDGTQDVNWSWDGEPIAYVGIGALEAAKQEMFHDQMHEESE